MTIKFIIPARKNIVQSPEQLKNDFNKLLTGNKRSWTTIPPAILMLMALTPKSINVIVEDENLDEINFDEDVDLVGISAITATVNRGYEIADEYRSRGVKVIMGGIHVSNLPQEALLHADSIVIGEVETVWRNILKDFKRGRLKQIYQAHHFLPMDEIPIPRFKLLKKQEYMCAMLETVRGCKYDCSFCTLKNMHGQQPRCKSVNRIVKEVRKVRWLNIFQPKPIVFIDKEFASDINRTKALLKRLVKIRNLSYNIQTMGNIFKDADMLSMLQESGCSYILLNYENQNNNSVYMKDNEKLDHYYDSIEKIQSKGMIAGVSFTLGYSSDTTDVFGPIADFIKKSKLVSYAINTVLPMPGSSLFNKLEKENRLLHKDWYYYDGFHTCFEPDNMSADELENGIRWLHKEAGDLNRLYDCTIDILKNWNSLDIIKIISRISLLYMTFSGHFESSFISSLSKQANLNSNSTRLQI